MFCLQPRATIMRGGTVQTFMCLYYKLGQIKLDGWPFVRHEAEALNSFTQWYVSNPSPSFRILAPRILVYSRTEASWQPQSTPRLLRSFWAWSSYPNTGGRNNWETCVISQHIWAEGRTHWRLLANKTNGLEAQSRRQRHYHRFMACWRKALFRNFKFDSTGQSYLYEAICSYNSLCK